MKLAKFNPIQNTNKFCKKTPNPFLQTDVYKMGHIEQYVPGCNKVYSYLQARQDRTFKASLWFGLQYYLKEYLCGSITHEHVDEFLTVRNNILGPTPDNVQDQLRNLADLGYWPLKIKALPEGTVIPVKNALMSITNTDPRFHWTVGFVESLLLKVWYPTTVATTSYMYRTLVEKYFKETVSDNLQVLKPFMVHDFGYRGDSSEEGAIISGMAHLLNFTGSDTVPAYNGILDYYGGKSGPNIMASVPASEHSVMCSYGQDNEIDAYRNMLKVYPTGIVSIVSDTYNIWNVLTNFAATLKPLILERKGKVVFRPDSGNPENIICGDPNADPNSPEGKGCIRLLDEMFGSTINEKGYRELNPQVGLIYGDGMYLERYERVLERLKLLGYASSNLVIGVGGILRHHSRDTMGFAIKATKVSVNGKEKAIMKDPITDKKKKSHQGYLNVIKVDNNFLTQDNVSAIEEENGLLVPVFENGKLLVDYDIVGLRLSINRNF